MKKGEKAPETIDEYIDAFPPEIRAILQQIRQTIRDHAPLAEEAIRYHMPTFRLNGNLVHFAVFKTHIGFYPTPSGIENFKAELAGYDTSKGTIRFALDQPIPYELIGKIVRFRVEEQGGI